MAGDWIKMGIGLGRHPKVVRIASALKADRLRVVGGLHAVWCLFDEHSEDGQLSGYTAELVDEMIGWPGFMAALVLVEWAEDHGETLSLPRFDAHNGQSAKRRAMEADRKREARKPSAPKADAVRTREEKRREDIPAKEKAVAPRGARLPADWKPSEADIAYAVTKGVDWKAEAENFADFWHAKAGKDACKTDWGLTWKTWIRRAPQGKAPPPPSSFGPKAAMQESETKLERALAYTKQRYERGEFGTGTEAMTAYRAECQAQTQKHRSVQ